MCTTFAWCMISKRLYSTNLWNYFAFFPIVTLTDEQKERMMRNRELAKQRQLEKKLEKQKLADEENTLGATTSEQNQIENPTVPHSTVSKKMPIFFLVEQPQMDPYGIVI